MRPEREAAAAPEGDDADKATPRADFFAGIAWVLFGAAVLAGSLAMDRLEAQHINPVTIPGLLPAALGIAIMLGGAVLAWRSHARGALAEPAPPVTPLMRVARRRVALTIGLCIVYSVGLIGRGMPFWLASALFIVGVIVGMQMLSLDPVERRITPGLWAKAVVIALGCSVVIHLVFQEVFLVRLP